MKHRCVWCEGLIIPNYDEETGRYAGNKCLMCGRSTDYEYELQVLAIQAVVPEEIKYYGGANSKYYGKKRRGGRHFTD